ncbi:hypothetical protein GOV13_02145 [Candidatus Pacearchaeota archaeon]|nr:hypothetical protein [Candidatus Pacearchaeota archaeon]
MQHQKIDTEELLFFPPKNIQEMLKGDLEIIYPDYCIFKRDTSLTPEFQRRSRISGLASDVVEFYNLGLESPIGLFDTQSFMSIFLDGVKNAFTHGPQDFPLIVYGLFLGDKGLCHGFKDFGDYFKSPEVKRQWESKEFIPSTKVKPDGPYNVGTSNILRTLVDYFEVDNSQGALFCVQSLKRLEIEPSDFFYKLMKKL